jgi:RNA polymerase sigma factor (sigma-70 family)
VVTLTTEEAAALVGAAAGGDRAAWEQLVDSYGRLVWAITRNHRLSPGDAADVSQTTWLRLLEHIDRLTEPGRVGAWLATTARRECLRIQARRQRTALVGDDAVFEHAVLRTEKRDLDHELLAGERAAAVRAAVATLPQQQQDLLNLMMLDPAPSYEEIAAALGRPIGSLGPTRRRCLERLRTVLEETGLQYEYAS